MSDLKSTNEDVSGSSQQAVEWNVEGAKDNMDSTELGSLNYNKREREPSEEEEKTGDNSASADASTDEITKKLKLDHDSEPEEKNVEAEKAAETTTVINSLNVTAYEAPNTSSIFQNIQQAAIQSITGSTVSSTGDTETIEVSQEKVGQIIGSRGAIIQDMQLRTGAKIYVDQNFPAGVPRQVKISGTPTQVQAASALVRRVIELGPTAIHVNSLIGGAMTQMTIECMQAVVGRVIGTSGATIKELQSRTGAKIQIEQDFPEGVPRKINISGTETAVNMAAQLVRFVMDNGPALPPLPGAMGVYGQPVGASAIPGMGAGIMGGSFGATPIAMSTATTGQQTHTVEVPKAIVGRIIGRGGETINMLQGRSGARMQVEQNVPVGTPCKVMITGNAQSIAMGVQLLNELMSGGPNMGATMAMGMGGAGAYGMGMGGGAGMMGMGAAPGMMGGYGQQQQQFPGAMGMPGMIGQAGPGMYGAAGMGMGMGMGMSAAPGMYGNPLAMQQMGGGMPGQMGAYPGMQQQMQQMQQQMAYGVSAAQASAAAPAAASPWSEHKTDDGNVYWYNTTTGVSQWERPANM